MPTNQTTAEKIASIKDNTAKVVKFDTGLEPEDVDALADALVGNDSLRRLDLLDCSLGAEGTAKICKALHHHTGLRVLRLDGNPIGLGGVLALAELIGNDICTIEELYLDRTSCFADTMSDDPDAPSPTFVMGAFSLALESSKITALNLNDTDLDDALLAQLASMFNPNISLRELGLDDNGRVTALSIKALMRGLVEGEVPLIWLSLNGLDVSAEAIPAIKNMLFIDTSLTCLSLKSCGLDDAAIKLLCEVLKMHPHLEFVFLDSNEITDAGAEDIADLMSENPRLAKISLQNNKITDAGAKELGAVIEFHSLCADLALFGNPISEDMQQELDECTEVFGRCNVNFFDEYAEDEDPDVESQPESEHTVDVVDETVPQLRQQTSGRFTEPVVVTSDEDEYSEAAEVEVSSLSSAESAASSASAKLRG
jgi:Ran GTPase-activating protein (RanGAP) involved in mRNA processing and transport